MKNSRSIFDSTSKRKTPGYTLIELIMVSGLAAIVLSVSVAAYYAWTRSTSSDTSVTKLEAMLSQARSHALARQRTTRVMITPGHKGASIIAERQIEQGKDAWLPIASSNRLAWTAVSEESVYFRRDGSCCLNYDEIDEATAEADAFPIDLENIPGRESGSRGRLRTILLDPGSGLFTVRERGYGDDGR